MIDRRALAQHYPFGRLERLLAPHAPGLGALAREHGGGQPIALSVGEPRRPPPAMIAETLAAEAAGWSRYPPARGTPAYLEACARWMVRRYGLDEACMAEGGPLDPARAFLALPGSREGLFFAVQACVAARQDRPPVVLIPNPFYHVYAGAAAAAGCEPVFVPARAETGFLPDIEALPAELLARTAFCFYCTPSNPQGAAADRARLAGLIRLARAHDFVLAIDECYSEIYCDDAAPPSGAIEAALALGEGLDRLLLFHSLSKRSSAPGLRCGFAAGDPGLIGQLEVLLRTGGAGVPFPVLTAGTRLWDDDVHARETRRFYQDNFAIAERVLGNRFGFRKPVGGFFLWLDVGDGEAATIELWRREAIKVLPGAYMAAGDGAWGLDSNSVVGAGDETGLNGGNPGQAFIRVALVYGPELTEAALGRMAEIL